MEHAVEGLGSPALGRGHTYSTGKQTSSGFGAVLQQELARADERQIAFSKHAIARAEERGIAVTPALAFIINVPHNRVITTLSQDEMKENIFTNIDGAVIL